MPGVLRQKQCSCAWVKLRDWQYGDISPWTYLEVPKATQKLWLLPAFVFVPDKKWVLMNTSSSKCPRWGSTDNPSAVSWQRWHQSKLLLSRGDPGRQGQGQGTLECPHLEVSVICLENLHLCLQLFHSYHLFSLSVYGKTLFKPCKTNLVYNVFDVPGWVLKRCI